MGVVARAVGKFVDDAFEAVGIDTGFESNVSELIQHVPGLSWVDEKLIAPVDKALLGTTAEELAKPVRLPAVEAQYPSRMNPAVIKTEGTVILEGEESLEEDIILGKSKRNRLRVPLTGGLTTPSAGASLAPTSTAPSSTGLSIG